MYIKVLHYCNSMIININENTILVLLLLKLTALVFWIIGYKMGRKWKKQKL